MEFVKLTCQQTAYIVGRGSMEELQKFHTGEYTSYLFSCTNLLNLRLGEYMLCYPQAMQPDDEDEVTDIQGLVMQW